MCITDNHAVIVLHPLSYRRGCLTDFLIFLTSRGVLIGNFNKLNVCNITAKVFDWKYNADGWDTVLPTVGFICYSNDNLDELIGSQPSELCSKTSLKGHFYSNKLSSYDTLVEYSKSEKQYLLYKDIFSL